MPQLRINATKARQNFFNLLDRVIEDDLEVVVTKEGLDTPVIMVKQSRDKRVKQINDQREIVKKTAGSIKTTGYKPDEFEIAKKIFREQYLKNNEQ